MRETGRLRCFARSTFQSGPRELANGERTWYQKSLVDWKYLEDHKTRDDNYVKHPSDVAKKMAKCDAALNGKTGK